MAARRLIKGKFTGTGRRSIASLGTAGLLLAASVAAILATADASRPYHQAARADRVAGAAESYGPPSRTAHLASLSGWRAGTPPAGNQLGFAVAISGNTAVVAAPGTKKAGAAYIYERAAKGSAWHFAAPLPDPRGASDDEYAWAVAISSTKAGTYVAVGGNNNNGRPDFVDVYKGSGKSWHLQAKLNDPGPSYQDMYGDSLAISSSTLVVGASCVGNNSGQIYTYVHGIQTWKFVATRTDPLDRAGDFYGQSVAVSGNRVLVGALDRAYVYTVTSGHRFRRTAIINNPGVAADNFGTSVALVGNTALIGAPGGLLFDPNHPPLSAGAAFVYTLTGNTWSRRARLVAPAGARGDEFGFSVAVSGSDFLIGQPVDGRSNCGTAFAFVPAGARWREREQIVNRTCTGGDQLGFSVAAAGMIGVVGAPFSHNQAGAFYVRNIP